MSPQWAPDNLLRRFPPTHILVGEFDPLLDDSVSFARRLKGASTSSVFFRVLPGLPHGFLSFQNAIEESTEAVNTVISHLRCNLTNAPPLTEEELRKMGKVH